MERLGGAPAKVLEGLELDVPIVGLDIETYSPSGFPARRQDPVVAATLAVSLSPGLSRGLVLVSMVFPPSMEGELLDMLRIMLRLFRGGTMVTYNGERFDLPYVAHRGLLHGLDLGRSLEGYRQLDVYKVVRSAMPTLPSYRQRDVEGFLGVKRLVEGVSGGNYHQFFDSFMRAEDLRPVVYNIEDSVGCLRILNRLLAVFKWSCREVGC